VTTPTARGDGAGKDAGVDAPDDDTTGWRGRWPFLLALGVPAFGTTFAITAVSTYLPSLIGEESGPLVTAAVTGGEGAAGLLLPILVGLANDRVTRTVTDRLRFVLLAAAGRSPWGSR